MAIDEQGRIVVGGPRKCTRAQVAEIMQLDQRLALGLAWPDLSNRRIHDICEWALGWPTGIFVRESWDWAAIHRPEADTVIAALRWIAAQMRTADLLDVLAAPVGRTPDGGDQ